MAHSRSEPEIFWQNPPWRGILPLERFHVPQRLARKIRQNPFGVTFNACFGQTIRECAKKTPARHETWINPAIEEVFRALHRAGHAHSVEIWRDGVLVGGIYGLAIGAVFFWRKHVFQNFRRQ